MEDSKKTGKTAILYPLSSIFYLLSSLFPPLLLLWLLTLPAITPLLQPTLTRSADGLLHLYRVVALDQLIRQGVFFSRWLPDLAFGYGLPLFAFYAPLSYYLTEGLHLLGLDLVGAFNASGALALLVAVSGVYLLVKDWFGAKAGVLAGIAYVYAPYQLFNLFSRGSLPVTWAGALFPLAFWAFSRLIRQNSLSHVPLAALILAAALLMHNISNLLFLPLLLLYLTIELLFTPYTRVRSLSLELLTLHVLFRTGLALALALALAAFFWLPATLEKEFAQVQRVITPPDFDYHANFVSLGQLFSLPHPANTGLLNPTDPFTLGLAQVTLAVIGLLAAFFYLWKTRNSKELRGTQYIAPLSPCSSAPLLFVFISLVIAIFMMLSASVRVWDSLPLIAFVQQPHRLLSVTAFLLAILAGAAVAVLPDRLGFSLMLGGTSLIFISAVPLLYPRYYDSLPAPPTLSGMMAYERATGAIGTTSFGEYLPIWVQQTPHESPLEPLYQTGATIERLDQAYLPPGARVESAAYGFNKVDLRINARQPYQAVFHIFYFPGWQASVDGQSAPLAPVTERGLIGVTMPAGQHRLLLQFGETPIRQAANILSLLALVAVIGLGFLAYRNPSHIENQEETVSDFTLTQFAILIGLALAFLLTKTLYLDRFDSPLKHVFTGAQETGAKVSRQVNFGHQVNLLGYDLNQTNAASGQPFNLTLYWQARQPLTTNYSALAQLVDNQQHLFAGQDNLHPGNLPSSRWGTWGFVRDRHTIQVPPGTPPGDYFLVAGLYDPATWARLSVVADGDPGWSDVIALPVTITRPTDPPTLEELGITWPTPQGCQPQEDVLTKFHPSSPAPKRGSSLHLCLLGVTPERETVQRNDFLRVALFWEAVETPIPDYQVSLRFLAADDTVVLTETSRPSFGRYPMPRWTASERIRDNHALWVPADFPAGTYRLQVQVLDEAGQPLGDWLELGQFTALAVQ